MLNIPPFFLSPSHSWVFANDWCLISKISETEWNEHISKKHDGWFLYWSMADKCDKVGDSTIL